MLRKLWPVALGAAGAFALACSDNPSGPTAPVSTTSPGAIAPAIIGGGGPTGAIFTTMPDGGVVNANVQYPDKLWVYLDGGPGPNAPQTAAGLDDGWYVFQITDPSGQYLLSMDPAKCRVVEVKDGVIQRLVEPSELGYADGYKRNGNKFSETVAKCHVQDAPDFVFGPSGRHDTNTDKDHGPPAIVVQMMPFGTTPNPGGVYKAWVTTLDAYTAKGGSLESVPMPVTGKAAQPCPDFCASADKGFGPPRNLQKTDNFKVKLQPPRISVRKFHDLNGNGAYDAGEPYIDGWKVTITETLYDGTQIVNTVYTPVDRAVAPNSTVQVCEDVPSGWTESYVDVDGTSKPVMPCVNVAFGMELNHAVLFGNFKNATKSGAKFEDMNANGVRDAGEPGLGGWTITLAGTDNRGNAVSLSTTTASDGSYGFAVAPGSYTVAEVCKTDFAWHQSMPATTGACGTGVYKVSFLSGDVDTGNDFGNWRPASKSGKKFYDRDGNGSGELGLGGVTIKLLDGTGAVVKTTTSGDDGAYSFTGLTPGAYIVCEAAQSGWYQTSPVSGTGIVDCTQYGAYAKYGYSFTLVSGQNETGNDFCNTANCVGLTPGYWVNWRNHYTAQQFTLLLQNTIAQGDIAKADRILTSTGCDDGDAIACMRRFLLSTQLTLNLTGQPSLPNPSGGDLKLVCQAQGDARDLGYWLGEALKIDAANGSGFSRDYILQVKSWLDTYANLRQIVYTP